MLWPAISKQLGLRQHGLSQNGLNQNRSAILKLCFAIEIVIWSFKRNTQLAQVCDLPKCGAHRSARVNARILDLGFKSWICYFMMHSNFAIPILYSMISPLFRAEVPYQTLPFHQPVCLFSPNEELIHEYLQIGI